MTLCGEASNLRATGFMVGCQCLAAWSVGHADPSSECRRMVATTSARSLYTRLHQPFGKICSICSFHHSIEKCKRENAPMRNFPPPFHQAGGGEAADPSWPGTCSPAP